MTACESAGVSPERRRRELPFDPPGSVVSARPRHDSLVQERTERRRCRSVGLEIAADVLEDLREAHRRGVRAIPRGVRRCDGSDPFLEQRRDDLRERRRNRSAGTARPTEGVTRRCPRATAASSPSKGRPHRQELVEDDAERVEIGRARDGLLFELLRGRVLERPLEPVIAFVALGTVVPADDAEVDDPGARARRASGDETSRCQA